MVVYNDFLDKFFKIEIFDLDDDDILLILGGYSHSDIIYHLNKILELNGLLLPNNLEASWKIGRIFGACRQVGIDDIIISKIIISPNNLKLSYFNFLAGYWDEINPNLENLMKITNFVIDNLIINSWNNHLSILSIEPIAIIYAKNIEEFNSNPYFFKRINIIKSYANKFGVGSPAKMLLDRI